MKPGLTGIWQTTPDRVLAGVTTESILAAYEDFKRSGGKKGGIPELWDGRASERIVEILINKL